MYHHYQITEARLRSNDPNDANPGASENNGYLAQNVVWVLIQDSVSRSALEDRS